MVPVVSVSTVLTAEALPRGVCRKKSVCEKNTAMIFIVFSDILPFTARNFIQIQKVLTISYLYGLEHYGNMPLIEHLEYQEVNRMEELVIAIDTSGSCSAATVRRFMEETYGILSDHENFFRKMNLYIIQCDSFIQDVIHVTCEDDWKNYLTHITIHGRGGTDFRPVFAYVQDLRNTGALRNLKGLLYFTDGDGIYPERPTDYQTAFIFYREKALHQKVPVWHISYIWMKHNLASSQMQKGYHIL